MRRGERGGRERRVREREVKERKRAKAQCFVACTCR